MPESADAAGSSRVRRGEFAALVAILLAALGVRVYLASNTETISRDTCTFVWFAQALAHDGVTAVEQHDQHPLYPVTILLVRELLHPRGVIAGDNAGWATAAVISACVAGLACIIAMWALTRFLFGPRVALVAALFTAVLPELAGYSADGLSDPLHLLLYLAALAVGVRGVTHGSLAALTAAGVLSGLAFLTRPEGAGVALVLAPACLLSGGSDPVRRRMARAALVLVGFGVIAGPYMVVTDSIVRKKALGELFQLQDAEATAAAPIQATVASADSTSAFGALVLIVRKWVRTCRVVYFVLGVLGAAVLRWPPGRRAACATLTAAGVVHFGVLMLLVLNFNYGEDLSQRHTLVLAALLLPWAAAGLDWIVRRVCERRPTANGAVVWTIALVVAIAPTSYWLLRLRNPDTAHLAKAGRWLAEHRPEAALVLSSEPRVAFYADKALKRWPAENARLDELLSHVDLFRPNVVALDVHEVLSRNPTFLDELHASPAAAERLTQIYAIAVRDQRKRPKRIILFDATPMLRADQASQPSSSSGSSRSD